jgi:predicted transcriptional regulator
MGFGRSGASVDIPTNKAVAAADAALHKKMLQLLSALWTTHAIGAFAQLDLADAIKDGADDPPSIAQRRNLNADRVYRLLRALSTVGIVTETAAGHFELTPLGGLLSSRSPQSMRATAIVLTDYLGDMWGRLADALASEEVAFESMTGQPLFAWLAGRPEEAARFHRMMVEVHGPETPAIMATYDFAGFRHIVDVGGGNGSLLSAILAAFPGRHATLFDLPEAIALAQQGEGGPLPGVTMCAGDVLRAVPGGGDAYLLRHVMHDFDDDDCRRILVNIRRAMDPQARVLVLEAPVPLTPTAGPGLWLDLHMMLLANGRERSLNDYARLFADAGLRLARTLPTHHPAMTVIEAVAASGSLDQRSPLKSDSHRTRPDERR